MIDSNSVAILLLSMWGAIFFLIRKRICTLYVYFSILFIMACAGLILPINNYLDLYHSSNSFSFPIILLFGLLLMLAIVPWYVFDNVIRKNPIIEIRQKYCSILKIVFNIELILSAYAVIYALPYALAAINYGSAADVRALIQEESFYPVNIYTTICVGVGFLLPINILSFYTAMTSEKFQKYTIPLFLSSFTYIITTTPFLARDGYFIIPIMHLVFYKIFNKSFTPTNKTKFYRMMWVVIPILALFFLFITLDRFWEADYGAEYALNGLISGTWGYLFQQPFIFHETITYTEFFQGFGKRFPLIAILLDIPISENTITYNFEYQFGTMFANFYSAFGWNSLICASVFFVLSWLWTFKLQISKNNIAGLLILFSVYLLYTTSGLFYLRIYTASITILYIFIIIMSLIIPNFYITKSK